MSRQGQGTGQVRHIVPPTRAPGEMISVPLQADKQIPIKQSTTAAGEALFSIRTKTEFLAFEVTLKSKAKRERHKQDKAGLAQAPLHLPHDNLYGNHKAKLGAVSPQLPHAHARAAQPAEIW